MSLIKFQVAFDIHGDMQDLPTRKAFFEFAAIWKPKLRICGGDLWDFRPLRAGASDDEKRETMRGDFKAGVKWFNEFKPTHFIRGNHDERLWQLAESDRGVASDYAQEMIGEVETMMGRHKCSMLPYHKRDGVLRIGSLKILHGFASGVYAARQTALVYGSALFGHVHTIDEHSIPGLERRVARSCGALCRLDMDYNARQMNTLRQANGWAYGVIHEKTGHYNVWQAEQIDGKWMLPTGFVDL